MMEGQDVKNNSGKELTEKSKEERTTERLEHSQEEGEINETDILKKKLEEKEKEAKDNYDRLLRVAAELENYKKRVAKEREELVKFANEELLRAIIPFIDNLERAVDHSGKTRDINSLVEGVRLTIQQIHQTLGRFGVTTFESKGKPFDPALHEAMQIVETDEVEPNHVVEEFQRGYMLNDRLLRPATVSVAKPVEKTETMN